MRASTAHRSPAMETAAQLSDAALSLAHVASICGDAFDNAYIDVEQSFDQTSIYVDLGDLDAVVLATDRLHDAGIFSALRRMPFWASQVAKVTFDDTTIHIGVRGTVK